MREFNRDEILAASTAALYTAAKAFGINLNDVDDAEAVAAKAMFVALHVAADAVFTTMREEKPEMLVGALLAMVNHVPTEETTDDAA